jgi:hypothetical protein
VSVLLKKRERERSVVAENTNGVFFQEASDEIETVDSGVACEFREECKTCTSCCNTLTLHRITGAERITFL